MIDWNKTEGYKRWTLKDFMEWHKGLSAHFKDEKTSKGYLKADAVWVNFFLASGLLAWFPTTVFLYPSQYKTEINYFEKNAPEIYKAIFANAIQFKKFNVADKAYTIAEAGANVVDSAVNIVSGFGKSLKYVIPIIIISGLAFGGYKLYKMSQ